MTATLEIDYPTEPRKRLSVFFRLILIVPIALIGYILLASSFHGIITVSGYVMFPTLFMILFRKKYPRWWFLWNLEVVRFVMRIQVYFLLLTDVYPSTDEEQSVHLTLPDPAEQDLSRGLPLVKWFLAIPHYIVLIILGIIVGILLPFMWVWVVITGNYPKSIFTFVVGYLRYSVCVAAYAVLLTTDKYPPFSLE